jgi:F-type H+-transporting ATPase subunit epsilon
MERTLTLEVATPDGLALEAQAEIVTAPSVAGEFGVLPDHLPMLAATRAGLLKFTVDGKDQVAAVGPGFVEAGPSRVLLLTDTFILPADVDKAAVEQDLAHAEQALKELGEAMDSHEAVELTRRVEWARAQLDAAAS